MLFVSPFAGAHCTVTTAAQLGNALWLRPHMPCALTLAEWFSPMSLCAQLEEYSELLRSTLGRPRGCHSHLGSGALTHLLSGL